MTTIEVDNQTVNDFVQSRSFSTYMLEEGMNPLEYVCEYFHTTSNRHRNADEALKKGKINFYLEALQRNAVVVVGVSHVLDDPTGTGKGCSVSYAGMAVIPKADYKRENSGDYL